MAKPDGFYEGVLSHPAEDFEGEIERLTEGKIDTEEELPPPAIKGHEQCDRHFRAVSFYADQINQAELEYQQTMLEAQAKRDGKIEVASKRRSWYEGGLIAFGQRMGETVKRDFGTVTRKLGSQSARVLNLDKFMKWAAINRKVDDAFNPPKERTPKLNFIKVFQKANGKCPPGSEIFTKPDEYIVKPNQYQVEE